MSKAEEFIKDCTRTCSNLVYKDTINGKEFNTYNEWLTPDQAREAVEIAREEIYEWLEENAAKSLIHYLKQTMEDE